MFSSIIGAALKGKDLLPLGAKSLRVVPILKVILVRISLDFFLVMRKTNSAITTLIVPWLFQLSKFHRINIFVSKTTQTILY